jgi:hypothetical protein
MNQTVRKKQFQALVAALQATGCYPLAKIELCNEITNAVTVTGEVPSEAANEALNELARQHGFIALAEDLFVRC